MMTRSDSGLLGEDEPAPALLFNAAGGSPFLLTGDHAGNAIPRALGDLGLSEADRTRHIAWDIGVRELGMALASALDAPFIHQPYSRLVIDCNRDPAHPEAAPALSDGSEVPRNADLAAAALAARVEAIHAPYHHQIARTLASRRAARRPTILLALHSFTPALGGVMRPWHVGILHDRGDTRFARASLAALSACPNVIVGDNEPYRMDDTDYSVPRHAYAHGLPYAEIEVRQDFLVDAAGIAAWSGVLCAAFRSAREAVGL